MFIFFPHSTESSFLKLPYISYLIIIACIIVFYFQYQNSASMEHDISSFCIELSKQQPESNMDKLVEDPFLCKLMIKRIEQRPDLNILEIIKVYFWFDDHTDKQRQEMAEHIDQHYQQYSVANTHYLNNKLMYYPETYNPVTMITSAFSHGNIGHIIGNLIFFLVFAPVVEGFVRSRWQFVASCLLIIVISSLTYSFSVLFTEDALPALGLSGLVMGMIGLFAALMPHEKIRVFVWVLFFIKNVPVPAWILALWYIGWDSFDLFLGVGDSATNLVAHVSGGISGYLLGIFWLRKQID